VTALQFLLLGALSAGCLAATLAWSRHLPKAPQVALAGFATAALAVSVLDVHFSGRTRGDVQEWVAVAATLLAVVGGGPVTVAVFTIVDRVDGGTVGEGLRGGTWIGALERLAIVGTLVAGWPEGMAVVLAIKALGRYPQLRHGDRPAAAEGFIIGTLVSILWAVACAYVVTGGIASGS